MYANQTPRARLDSWKDIARYLKKHERTVTRWEKKNGLPVHRVPGGPKQAVFAYTDEIDAWLVSRNRGGSAGTKLPPWLPHLSKRTWLVLGCLAAIALLVSGLVVRSHAPAYLPEHNFKQLTDDGRSKSGLRTDGTTLYFNVTQSARSILMSAPMSGSPMRIIDTPFPIVLLQDLSSDGKTLLVTSHEGIAYEGPLWTIPAQGGTPKRMGGAVCSVAHWSPDNRKIACALRATISLLDADGSNSRVVGSFSTAVGQVKWRPDGGGLRVALEDPGPYTYSLWDVAITKENNSTPSPVSGVPTDGSCGADFAWMQDGKVFAYVTVSAGYQAHLMVQTGQSSREVQLPTKANLLYGLATAKNSLYAQIGGAPRGELLTFDQKHGVFQTFLPGLSADYLSFSRDRQWMTYVNIGDNSLWRSRADGSEPVQLTKPPMDVEVSAWSPDGGRIAFMGREPGKPWRIYLTGRNGGQAQAASDGNDNQGGPSWSPDGKSIVYGNVNSEATQEGLLRRVDVASGNVDMVPESQNFRTARWSPDGRHIAAIRWQSRELMLFDTRSERWKIVADAITGDNLVWSGDSQFVYVDNPRQSKPVVERIRVRDRQRTTVVNLAPLQKAWGGTTWVGLTPDSSHILSHLVTASEIYELKWTDR